MRRPNALTQMEDILKIRQAQRYATEIALTRAQNAVEQLTAAQQRAAEKLSVAHHEWSRLTSGSRLSLPIVRAWSQTIARGEADFADLAERIEAAEGRRAAQLEAHRLAEARQDAAGELTKTIRRRIARKNEETQAAAWEDRPRRAGAPT